MSKAFCPGSYDPLTLGHIDIIKRCAELYDSVVVAVGINPSKEYMLSIDKRRKYCIDAFSEIPNISVISYEGYTVDAANDCGADFIVKGVRNDKDRAYEDEMAAINRELSSKRCGKSIETVLIDASPEYKNVSSTLVREKIREGHTLDGLVHNPELLYEYLKK